MIITEQKDFAEILRMLEGHSKVFLVGCGSCATSWQTGGEKQVQEMAERLRDQGKIPTGGVVVESVCDERLTRLGFRQHASEVAEADAFLVMSCGAGVQTAAGLLDKPVYPALNALFLGRIQRLVLLADERCVLCGECVLAETGGICPMAVCSKSLLNGPCGGYRDGKCEVDQTRDCGWVLIYERLRKLGQLEKMRVAQPLKDYSRMTHPRRVDKRQAAAGALGRGGQG